MLFKQLYLSLKIKSKSSRVNLESSKSVIKLKSEEAQHQNKQIRLV